VARAYVIAAVAVGVTVIAASAVVLAFPAATPNLESCANWDDPGPGVVASLANHCNRALTVLFMQVNTQTTRVGRLAPGERFDAGMSREQMTAAGYMSTVCPVGFSPSVPFTYAHRQVVFDSSYYCVGDLSAAIMRYLPTTPATNVQTP
jgi:hypothetical protein